MLLPLVYRPTMIWHRTLGWELNALFMLTIAVAIASLVRSEALLFLTLGVVSVAGPLALVSFLVRLCAGILAETRGRRAQQARRRQTQLGNGR